MFFTLVDRKVGRFNDSKHDLFANCNITLNWGTHSLKCKLSEYPESWLKMTCVQGLSSLERMELTFLL